MNDRFSNQAVAEMSRDELVKVIRDLEALATVYDVTVSLLVAMQGGMDSLDPIAKSQVEAARSACLEITGEESLVGFSRYNQPTEHVSDHPIHKV